jgi:hypothetical protein
MKLWMKNVSKWQLRSNSRYLGAVLFVNRVRHTELFAAKKKDNLRFPKPVPPSKEELNHQMNF